MTILGTALLADRPDAGNDDAQENTEWQRFSERCASDSLRTLTPAAEDFRAYDRDWCNVNDFWTSNVQALYTMTSAQETIKLIELAVTSADYPE